MIDPTDTAVQDVESVIEPDVPAHSEHSSPAVGDGSTEVQQQAAPDDSAKAEHEIYMFGDHHAFVD